MKKIRDHGHACDRIVFVTTQQPTANQKDSLASRVKKAYGWDLEFYDLERIATLIDGPHSDLKRLHPNIFYLENAPVSGTVSSIKHWVRIPTFIQRVSIQPALETKDPEAIDRTVREIVSLVQSCLMQATAKAFENLSAIETVVLFSFNIEGQNVNIEITSHRFALIRWLTYFFGLYKKDPTGYLNGWAAFRSEWKNATDVAIPIGSKLFPLGIMYNREIRLIQFRRNLVNSTIELPKTTDDFLMVIGTMANAPPLVYFRQFGPAAHPLNKMFCFMADNNNTLEPGRTRVNADNPDEFDYVYEEYDREVGLT